MAFGAWLTASLLGCGSREDLVIGRDDYSLVRHDDFDQLDLDFWELATHTFDPNLAYFTAGSAKVEQGLLVLSITADPSPPMPAPMQAQKPYSAAELRSRANYLYGSYRARVRVAGGPGVVTAFWGFYDRYEMSSGPQIDNQIVIESGVAKDTGAPCLRYAVNVPMGAPDTVQRPTGFEPSTEFHELGYDWSPTEVRFYLDGQTSQVVAGDAAPELTQYQRLVLSAYPSQAGWISPFDPSQLPLRAEFDWVEIRAYRGSHP
ncbi:MAG TPA: glycoside hydrolase family 16 protein [Polyangiaceae bacterium]|nr:glycoside hydrolase family 16 protein [Polyangiaceae bacterium]